MTNDMIKDLISKLSKYRPIFHSEADFQHELSFLIHKEYDNVKIEVRLEKPMKVDVQNTSIYCDIFFRYYSNNYVIELKYKTKKFETRFNGEDFNLTTHAATNLARYDFISDISRIERLKEQKKITNGFAIFLTNDSSYWNDNSGSNLTGKQFYFSENSKKHLTGELKWENNPSISSIGTHRQAPIILKNIYHPEWYQYSMIYKTCFRYLIFKI